MIPYVERIYITRGFVLGKLSRPLLRWDQKPPASLQKREIQSLYEWRMKRGRPFPELPTLWSTKPSLCFVWRAPPCIPLWWAPQWYWKPLLKSFGLLPHSYHPRRVRKSGCLFEWVLEALEGEKRELEKVVLDISARGHVKALCSCARSASRGILAEAVHRAAVNPSKVWERKGGAETEAKHGRGNVTHGVTELPLSGLSQTLFKPRCGWLWSHTGSVHLADGFHKRWTFCVVYVVVPRG